MIPKAQGPKVQFDDEVGHHLTSSHVTLIFLLNAPEMKVSAFTIETSNAPRVLGDTPFLPEAHHGRSWVKME